MAYTVLIRATSLLAAESLADAVEVPAGVVVWSAAFPVGFSWHPALSTSNTAKADAMVKRE
jgi:hypothetical protein